MTKRLKALKLWPVWVAVSAVIIIAGIVLFALLGFNNAAELPKYKTFEVTYSAVAEIREKEEGIATDCETVFKDKGLTGYSKSVVKEVAGSYNTETGNKKLVYTFASNTDNAKLEEACTALKTVLNTNYNTAELMIETSVSVHTVENKAFGEEGWRAAVAIAVGVVVVLIYIGIRYGVGSGLSGLIGCVNSVFFTLGLVAITRIPVYVFSPLLYAAIAAISSLLLWMINAIAMKSNFKDPSFENFKADEAVAESLKTSEKMAYITAGALALIVLVVGLVATAGVRTLVLPALIPVAVSVYSSMLFAPSVHVHFKRAFDKMKAKHKPKYVGKKKAEKEENN